MTRFTASGRGTAVVPLAAFDSLNDGTVTLETKFAIVHSPAPDAGRPPCDYDTARAPVDPSVTGWPAVGMTRGSTIQVRLRRIDLDVAAPLEVRSSDPARLRVGFMTPGHEVAVPLHAPAIARAAPEPSPDLVRVEAVWNGQVVAGLAVYIHDPLRVRIHVHRVVTRRKGVLGAPGTFPSLAPAMVRANAIWAQAGVEFTLVGETPLELEVAHDLDFVDDGDESQMFEEGAKRPGVVNMYLVRRHALLSDDSNRGTGAHTAGVHVLENTDWARPFFVIYDLPPPKFDEHGVAYTMKSFWEDPADFVRMIGHELGHFFEMDHPLEKANTAIASVTVQRLLLYPYQPSGTLIPCGYDEWIRDTGWSFYKDKGVTKTELLKLHGSRRARRYILKHGYAVVMDDTPGATLELVGLEPDGKEVPAHTTLLVRKRARFKARFTPGGDPKDTYLWTTSTVTLQVGDGKTTPILGAEVEVTGLTGGVAKLKVTWTSATTGKSRETEVTLMVVEGLSLLFVPFPGSTLPGRSKELLRGPFDVEEGGQTRPLTPLASGAFTLRSGAVLRAFDTEYEGRPAPGEPTPEQMLSSLGYRGRRVKEHDTLQFQYDHDLATSGRFDDATVAELKRRVRELP